MNPFTQKEYAGPEYFCNRVKETMRIINTVENQRNLTLSSLRKMGKTGLIHHVFNRMSKAKEFDMIYFDIYHTSSAFLKNHDLSNTWTIKGGIHSLVDKKMVYK